ncbi:MAG: methyltransferase type 11 [Chloroflexi bacterium RBG_16_52_11]|nr:MAG: methyltransferase type 11 [Chloroflexi bacterium RBG_16_52_11]
MTVSYSEQILNILTCPFCSGSLEPGNGGSRCGNCGTIYPYTKSGTLDLRLKHPRPVTLTFEIGGNLPSIDALEFKPLIKSQTAAVDFSPIAVPYHLSEALMSYFPRAHNANSLMLDLGCGNGIHREVCEHAGFQYVGLDYDSPGAPFLGDAHALPFKDYSFEFILSIAVLEHIRYPFVMMAEAFRVLKPGGKLIGTVAFLEPFHLDSYYHHSHLGTFNSLQYAGFLVQQVAPSDTWTGLKAQAAMGLFQRMPRVYSSLLIYPLHLLHRLWWRARVFKSRGKRVRMNDLIRNTTGAFSFIASKSNSPEREA